MLLVLHRALGMLRRALPPPASGPEDVEIALWRERILDAFLIFGTSVGTVALAASLVLAWQEKLQGLAAGNILSYLTVVGLIVLRRRFSFRARALATLSINYLLGIGIFLSVGLMSGATLVLFAFPVLTAVLLGLRPALVALGINAATATVTVIAIHLGFDAGGPYFVSTARASAAGGTFMLFNVVATLAVGSLVQALQSMAQRERAARESLRASEEEYRALVQGANSVILRLDAAGVVRFANEHAAATFGGPAPSHALEGRAALGTVFLDDDGSRQALSALRREGAGPIEARHRRADGETAWIVWTGRVLAGSRSGASPDLLCVGNDITERRKLEGQLRQSQKLEALGTLAGGIAHDFNNILAAMMTNTEMAQMDAVPGSALRTCLDETLQACHRARELARQILVFSRKGQREPEPAADLHAVAAEALKLLRATLPSTIEIRSRLGEGRVAADPTELHQVVMNLATNAGHAMREKGGLLELSVEPVELEPPHLPAEVTVPGPYVKLSLSDTGLGMTPEVQERIFDPYFTTKPSGEGSGLGLAVVHGIVRARRGAVVVRSEPGAGTTFEVYLPRAKAPVAAGASGEAQAPPRGTEPVLVVDDEEAILRVMSRMLQRLGYQVSVAASGREALELVTRAPQRFALVISDLTMPGMTGDLLAEELRRVRADLPVLLCSGYAPAFSSERLAQIGVKGLVAKPVTTLELACAMRKAIAG